MHTGHVCPPLLIRAGDRPKNAGFFGQSYKHSMQTSIPMHMH